MNMPLFPVYREFSPEAFRIGLTDTFGNGERMSNYIAGLERKEWPKRLSRPDPKTCRSWMRGDTDPRLTAVVALLKVMAKIKAERDNNLSFLNG